MKKFLALLLILTLVMSMALVVLAGCVDIPENPPIDDGGDDNPDKDNPPEDKPSDYNPSDYDHKIIFYSSQGDALQQKTAIAIANFQAKYPGWTVEHITQGGYDDVKTKVVQNLQAGLQPDLAYCYADHVAQYIASEQVVDMSKFINSTATVKGANDVEYAVGYTAEEIADFVPGYYAEGFATNYSGYAENGYTDSSMLTLPFVKSTELMYYNADALKACGLTPATTWDEIWEQAPIIRAKYPTATVLAYDSEANWFITMCEQNGWGYTSADESQHFLFNDKKSASWLESLNEYWENGWLTTKEDYNAYTSGLFIKGVEDGGCVYCIGSSGGASYQTSDLFEAKIAPIPGSKQADGTVKHAAISQGPSLVMFNAGYGVGNADEKAMMTFLFVKELLDPTFQATFSIQAGYNPVRQSTYDIPAYQEHMEGSSMPAMACKVALEMTNYFFTSPAFSKSSTARTQVGNVLLYVMTGAKTANKALNDAYKNCGGK